MGPLRGIGIGEMYILGGVILLVVIASVLSRVRGGNLSIYVITSWRAGSTPIDDQGTHVTIRGRAIGLWSWLLSLIGIEASILMNVTRDNVVFEVSSWSGFSRRVIPLPKVSSTLYGYTKPWIKALILFFVLSMLFSSLAGGIGNRMGNSIWLTIQILGVLISIAVAILYYVFNKVLTLAVVEEAGPERSIRFKRSLIENQSIDEKQAASVVAIIQNLIDQKMQGISRSPGRPATASPASGVARTPAPPVSTICPKCGATYPGNLSGQFCERCGTKM